MTDLELVRTHASLRKQALAEAVGNHGAAILREFREHAPALGGALLGGIVAPEGKGMEGALAGATGGIVGKAVGAPATGALIGPVAYSVYHHLTQPDPGQELQHGRPY